MDWTVNTHVGKEELELSICIGKYVDGRLAVHLLEEGSGPYAALSVNVAGADLEEDEFVLNHDLNSFHYISLRKDLVSLKCFRNTGKTVSYGYVMNQPVWKFVGEANVGGENSLCR